nr:MAG TPA: hypothetical protein [Caudoviricetes sp.]
MGKEEKAFPGTKAHPEALRIPLTRRLFRGQKEWRRNVKHDRAEDKRDKAV